MKSLIALGAVLMLAACAMPQGGMQKRGGLSAVQQAPLFVDELVQVETDPAGASVRINGEVVANAPLKVTVRRYWHGEPGRMDLDTVKIEALPAADGQCVKSGVYGQNNLEVPSPVRFNMSDCAMYEHAQPAAVPRRSR